MIKKELPIYICSAIDGADLEIIDQKDIADHKTGNINGKTVIIPTEINSNTINPKNFLKLKKVLEIDQAIIIDKIKGTDKTILILDHVNLSGQNFLRSNTPIADLPQFPDMSKIYKTLEGFEKAVVHTVGVERFVSQEPGGKFIFSELVGLIAPVMHYVGIKIFALGGENPKKVIELISEQ